MKAAESELPTIFHLEQNFPNPFNSDTLIRFILNRHESVTLVVYNIVGEKVAVLLSDELGPGRYSVRWDGKNHEGRPVSSGIYLYELRTFTRTVGKKMILLR